MRRLIWALVLVTACDCTDPAGSEGDGGGGGLGDGGSPCTSSFQCPSPQVCDPGSNVCVTDLPCSGHLDCGTAAHCSNDDRCTRSTTGSPCENDANCGSGRCTGGFCGCVGDFFTADVVPPNVMILLDRSNSMHSSVAGTGQTRWQIALAAIEDLVTTFGNQVRFGVALYPGINQTCESATNCTNGGNVFIDPDEDTAAQIVAFFESSATTTCSQGTPTRRALENLVGRESLQSEVRPNFVVLITDGEVSTGGSCNPSDPSVPAQTLFDQDPSVRTFAVGFSEGINATARGQLNAVAVAGGTAIGDPGDDVRYYDAGDPTVLGELLADIAGSVLSCSYSLNQPPLDLNDLYIYHDGTPISRDQDQEEGWNYDNATNQVTFYGNSCENLLAGSVEELVIVYGCPIAPPD